VYVFSLQDTGFLGESVSRCRVVPDLAAQGMLKFLGCLQFKFSVYSHKQPSDCMEEIKAMLQETAELERQNREALREVAARFRETDEKFRETDEKFRETDGKFRELREEVRKTERLIQATGKQLGELGVGEDMLLASAKRIMRERFGAECIAPNAVMTRNRQTLELDVLGYVNRDLNNAVIAEVKAKLKDEHVGDLLEKLAAFPEFFPEHRQKHLFGILAGGNVPVSVRKLALKHGLYVGRMADHAFQLLVPDGFEGLDFQAA
jgi:hypothetical protein